MDDLQLLELLERAKQKQKGDRGPAGVGIESISQFEENSFTIKLTTGEHKKVALQPGADGAVGPQGQPGPKGDVGPAGRAGKDGAPGRDGRDGDPGPAGVSLETSVVNSNGHLLLGLTDGSVVDCGRVVGPAGATGERGPTGLPGAAGKDGTAVLSGPRAPQQDDGQEGDFWIDVSSAEFSFFKKNGDGWTKLANLRQPAVDPRVGPVSGGAGSGGSGGGGGVEQTTATLPLANPTRYKNHGRALPPSDGLKSQKDLNEWVYSVLLNFDADGSKISVGENAPDPAEVGMLWFSTNEDDFELFIYVDAVSGWVPATPLDEEVFVDSRPPNDPEEGKLWYDSSGDVLELFIYVEGKWVSATPNSEYALESRIASNEQGIRDLWSDQTRQDFEIASLDNRVDALEGVVGEFQYVIQTANESPRDGQLSFLKADMSTTTRWAEATNIAVNPNSISGEVWATDEIVTGDVLRFHLKGDITMQVSAFEAKVVQNNNNLFGIDTVVKEVGTIMDGAEYEVFHLSSFDPSGLATMTYVDAQDKNLKDYTDGEIADLQKYVDEKVEDSISEVDSKVSKTGDTMTGDLCFDNGSHSVRILNGTKLRFTGSDPGGNQRTFIDIKNELSSGVEGAEDGYRMRLYHLSDPTSPRHATNKKYVDESIAAIPAVDLDGYATEQYVDDAVANAGGGGVPVGSIMIWMNSSAPNGWFKLQGGNFDTSAYPQLHAYLQKTSGYTSGKLPNWGGHYPGEYGDHLNNSLGSKQGAKTAQPSGGAPQSSASIPNGNVRSFNSAGGTNAYSDGKNKVAIDEGWDDVTRPKTVIVHYIIKHD